MNTLSFANSKFLSALPNVVVRDLVAAALREDLGNGDVTSDACIDAQAKGKAILVAREPLVVSGIEVFREAFVQVDANTRIEIHLPDGSSATKNQSIATVSGYARSLLKAERVALNFAQRMSGIATQTRSFVDAIPEGKTLRITDTRKTTPLLRPLERFAVRCGGGFNHRNDLSSAVLIKDNHIAACGGVRVAIERARAYAPHTSRIECEVDRIEQLLEALDAKADIVLLDNFTNEQLEEAVRINQGRAILEVSGGVSLDRIPFFAKIGLDVASVGALTHSARAVDLGLDWE